MTTIGILGDTHGSAAVIRFSLWLFAQRGIKTVLQVGDFGIGQKNDIFHKTVERECADYGITLWVVPGNHENYDTIERLPSNEDGTLYLSDHISILPRGYRWTWAGRSFVALGGAPSVDRQWRLSDQRQFKTKLWWIQEAITVDDVSHTIDGGYADVMVCHDAPHSPVIDAGITKGKSTFPLIDLYYADEGRALMEQAFSGVRPHYFFHGHYHFKVEDVRTWDTGDESVIIGLDCDAKPDAFATLDLDSFQAAHIPAEEVTAMKLQYFTEKGLS